MTILLKSCWVIVKKNFDVALTQLFLTYIIVEEYFIISITFMFNFYFLGFVADELPASIIIVYSSWT